QGHQLTSILYFSGSFKYHWHITWPLNWIGNTGEFSGRFLLQKHQQDYLRFGYLHGVNGRVLRYRKSNLYQGKCPNEKFKPIHFQGVFYLLEYLWFFFFFRPSRFFYLFS